jgi:hypothetical protein
MKYDWNPTREFVIDVTIIVCRSSKLSGHVAMVFHSVATQFFATYMTVDCLFERPPITTAHFHRFALFNFFSMSSCSLTIHSTNLSAASKPLYTTGCCDVLDVNPTTL